MPINRRHLLHLAASSAIVYALPASAAPPRGLDAAQFGVRPGAVDDQSRALQRAIDRAARSRTPLWLAPGVYRAGDLKLPAGAQVSGVRGATRFAFTRGPSLFSSEHADTVALTGLTLDGGSQKLPPNRGLVHLNTTGAVRIADCQILGAGGNAIALEQCDGEVVQSTITGAADNAVFCIDSRGGVRILGNTIAKSGNGGIRVWQGAKRADGSLVADNRIDDTGAAGGGDGENGNGINVFRAADVTVRNNTINRAAFSAVRGNAASNFLVIGNTCAGFGETAMYAEFDFVGATFADNIIDGAENGISVTNFDRGGRLGIVRGNTVRNLGPRRPGSAPEGSGVGISAEADTIVSGNTIENASQAGIQAGWGQYLKDVTVTGNTVRDSNIGVAVSVVANAGAAVITGNRLNGSKRGAILGMEWHKAVTGDLALAGAERYPKLRISGNRVN